MLKEEDVDSGDGGSAVGKREARENTDNLHMQGARLIGKTVIISSKSRVKSLPL